MQPAASGAVDCGLWIIRVLVLIGTGRRELVLLNHWACKAARIEQVRAAMCVIPYVLCGLVAVCIDLYAGYHVGLCSLF